VAVLAAAMLAVCPVMFWEARQARADMVLVLCTCVAMWGLWNCVAGPVRGRRSKVAPQAPPGGGGGFRPFKWSARAPADDSSVSPPNVCAAATLVLEPTRAPTLALAALWLATAAGVLTKGPITPMVVAFTILFVAIVAKRWSLLLRVAPVFGLVIILALCLPWLFAVMQRIGADVYWRTIYDETVGRSLAAKEGHTGLPGLSSLPGYHLLFSPLLLFPGSLGLGVGLWSAVRYVRGTWRSARRGGVAHLRPEVFLAGWLVPTWIVFELVKTKLPHYTMPLYPALALLCAKGLLTTAHWAKGFRTSGFARVGIWTWIVGAGMTSAVMWSVPAAAIEGIPTVGLAAAIVFAAIGAVVTIVLVRMLAARLRAGRFGEAVWVAIGGFALGAIMLAFAAPSIGAIWVTRGVMKAINAADPQGVRPIAAVGYQEDSLIFETRGRAVRLPAEQLKDWFKANPDGLVVIDEPNAKAFPDLVFKGGTRGFNYSNGRRVEVTVGTMKK